jgi:hypothetical protein
LAQAGAAVTALSINALACSEDREGTSGNALPVVGFIGVNMLTLLTQ